jgi:hypothetical protein
MSLTLVEKYPQNKTGSIAIKPYFDQSVNNMGLEKYGLSLFDGVFHEEQLACLEINGVKRYLTGLNEFAPEVKNLPEDEREAKAREIRKVVSQLEKELNSNVVDPEDKDFWNKIELLKPSNSEFWDKIVLRCGNDPLYLEPSKDPYDLIKLYAINAGGFTIVAGSYDDARKRPTPPKFYLDIAEETVGIKTELKKMRNKALSELQKMYDKNINKLFYVCKIVDVDSAQYRKNTPNDVMYDNMDRYINGETVERDKKLTAERFLNAVKHDLATLKLKAIAKDAAYHKFIVSKSDGFIYHLSSSTMLGRNLADVVEFMKNPINQDLTDQIVAKVEEHWKG